jgi:hypothetical protein
VISLQENRLTGRQLDELFAEDIKAQKELFASPDTDTAARLRELGYAGRPAPWLFDFRKLLRDTEFPA